MVSITINKWCTDCSPNESPKIKNLEANFLGNNAAFSIEKARLCNKFFFVENCTGAGTGIGAGNRNQNFSKVGTGTAINHYGSTTTACGILPLKLPALFIQCIFSRFWIHLLCLFISDCWNAEHSGVRSRSQVIFFYRNHILVILLPEGAGNWWSCIWICAILFLPVWTQCFTFCIHDFRLSGGLYR